MSRLRFAPRVRALEPAPTVDALLVALGGRRGFAALEGQGPEGEPWIVLAFDPLSLADPALPTRPSQLAAFVRRLASAPGDAPPGPFAGGFVGALAYDLGVEGEGLALPPDPWDQPPLVGGLYVDFVVAEPRAGRAWLVLGDEPGDGRPSLAARGAELGAAIEAARAGASPEPRFVALGELVRRVPSSEHRRRIEVLRGWIGAGELYQANLAHAFVGRTRGHPLELFRLLRRASPAPHAGYLGWEGALPGGIGGAIVSASPELLLEVEGERALTRPIKGTARRSPDPVQDARLARELLSSTKDGAELAMIVDLERNDLGRVARPGSVRVDAFPALRSFAGVHHLTADVRATLAPGVGAADALAALFPGGSISGAPKLRALRAIAELEGEGRGFFTGSLGFLDLRGRACFDVLIRTFQWRALAPAEPDADPAALAGEVRLHVGGGITFGSDPAAEDAETLVKAARLLGALGQDVAPEGELPARERGA